MTVAFTYTGGDRVTRETFARLKTALAAEPGFRLVHMGGKPTMAVRLHHVRRNAQGLSFLYSAYVSGTNVVVEFDAACAADHEQDCTDAFMQGLEDLADRLTPSDRP